MSGNNQYTLYNDQLCRFRGESHGTSRDGSLITVFPAKKSDSPRHVTVIIYSVSRYKVLSSLCNGSRCYLLSSTSTVCARFAKLPTRSWEPSADASFFYFRSNFQFNNSIEQSNLAHLRKLIRETIATLFLDLIVYPT